MSLKAASLATAGYALGRWLAVIVWAGIAVALVRLFYDTPWFESSAPGRQLAIGFAVLAGGSAVGVIVHEFGHLLACLAVGAQVQAFRLGDERGAIRFGVRNARVTLGWPYRGRVEYVGARSAWRRAVITIAGSLADLALAGVLLALPVERLAASGLALVIGGSGISSLIPLRSRDGRLSDGARLLRLRATAARANVAELANSLRRQGKAAELLALHAGMELPAGPVTEAELAAIVSVEWSVANLPDLPADAASLAELRVDWLLEHGELGRLEPRALLTLAMLHLKRRRFAEAGRLCDRALASERGQTPAMVFTMKIVAMRALGQPYAELFAQAIEVHPNADLHIVALEQRVNPKACAAVRKDLADFAAHAARPAVPERTTRLLQACRDRDPLARVSAGVIAFMLRKEGRIAELLELHAALPSPSGAWEQPIALREHLIAWNVLALPGLPADAVELAASRVQWVLGNPRPPATGQLSRAAALHTLAVARLRQARFEEVEPLCAEGLAADHGPEARATMLATVALARRALSRSYDELLAEAVALSPDADLVAEAVK